MKWDYFDNGDGSVFRRPSGPGFVGGSVQDIWTPTGWEPYTGDRLAPVVFGSKIDATDLPEAARPK